MNEAVSYAEYSGTRAKTKETKVKEYPDVSVPEYKSTKAKSRPYVAPEPKPEPVVAQEVKPRRKVVGMSPSYKEFDDRPSVKKRPSPAIEPSIKEPSPAPEPEPDLGLKYPSSLDSKPAKKPTPVTPKLALAPREPGECELPFIEAFSNGFNDSIQAGAANINSNIAPWKISGDYRISLGATEDDFIWKDANADYHNMPGDVSWRYIYGKDRHNTFDKKIYSRYRASIEGPITDNLDAYAQMVIDPWTFVGKKRVFATGSNGDSLELEYKYWSNVRSTINETYRTDRGDIVSIAENKVHDGRTSVGRYSGLTDWGTNTFTIPEQEIDRMYVPIRKLWLDYNDEPYHARVFLMSSQDEALSSDDPLRLSNNKVWWEESAWLDRYEPSKVFNRAGTSAPSGYTGLTQPLKKGQWVRNLSFVAKDSEDDFLTFLRGVSFGADFDNGASVDMTIATPRNLWDEYEQATSIPAAIRVKAPISDKFTIGGLYGFKGGMRHDSLEAINNTAALDGTYQLFDNTEIVGEIAVSNLMVDEASGYDNDYTGAAGKFGIKNQGPLKATGGAGDRYEVEASIASMSDDFFPGLSSYRFSRREFEFAKHIYFDDLDPRNEEIMFGDGLDIARNAINLNAFAEFPDAGIDTKFDFRAVFSDGNEHIEDVYRVETTYKTTPKLTLKGLAFYKHLPDTTAGYDPLINAKNSYSAFTDYFAYEDLWLENAHVEGDKDPSIGAFSLGAKYDFTDYFSGTGIYEITNDPKDYPRGLLNNVWVGDFYEDDVVWDRIVPFVYNQSSFGLPPYDYYNIYKLRFSYSPFRPIDIGLRYTYNDNKYSMIHDGNGTSQGVEIKYRPCERMTLGFLYQYARQRDIYKEFVLNQGMNFDGHHNMFASMEYQLNRDQKLSLSYGEYLGYGYSDPEKSESITALDTRHIVRLTYTGSWGASADNGTSRLTSIRHPLGEMSPNIPGAKFIYNFSVGGARFRERAEIVPVESKWDDYFARLELGIDAYDREYWEGSLRLGLFTSLTDQEEWDYEGIGEYQKNDMSFRGADINANIGWAFSTPSKYLSFTPLINAGYRRVEFARSGIATSSTTVSQLGEEDQNFNVGYLGVGGRLEIEPADGITFYGSGYWAPLVYTPVNNSVLGRIECNDGLIWHGEGGLDYSLSDRFDLNIGAFWDQQKINRETRIDNGTVNAEIPDSTLETVGLTLGGLYKF